MIGKNILTIDDLEFQDKTVILRVDLNSPIDSDTNKIMDDSRIKEHAKTVRYLSSRGAKIVIMAHQGDPLFLDQFIPLKEHAQILSKHVGKKVEYIDDIFGPAAREAIKKLRKGNVLLLENTRFFSEDTRLFEDTIVRTPEEQSKTLLVQKLYPLADIFVNDAFAAAHRSQPSLVGFAEVLPSAAGLVLESELRALMKIKDNPEKPCVFCLGGRKVSDRYVMIETVIKNNIADKVLTSGIIGLLMLKAAGYNGGSPTDSLIKKLGYEKYLTVSKKLLQEYGERIEYPVDVVLDKSNGKEIDLASLTKKDCDAQIVDIGRLTVEKYSRILIKAKTVFFSGPPGVFENKRFSIGTNARFDAPV